MSNAHEHTDRREHARFEVLDVAMIEDPSKSDPVRAVIIDVSLGGIQVRARETFDKNSFVLVQIGRPGEEPIRIPAEIRYCKDTEKSELFAAGLKVRPKGNLERIAWVNYVHSVFQDQGESLTS